MVSRRGLIQCSICGLLVAPSAAAAQGGRRAGTGIIDVHAHVQVGAYLAAAAEVGLRPPRFGPPAAARPGPPAPAKPSPAGDSEAAVALRLRLMDEAGVRLQVLSPTLAPYVESEAAGAHITRLLNDGQAALTRQHKGRLAGFVSLPLPHVEASLAELRRGLDELGMAGVTMQTSVLGRSVVDERFEPLFRELNARKAVLFLHPAVNGLMSPLIRDWGLTAPAGPLLEDVTIALHLMVKSIPVRFPDIKIIVAHLGGGLATMLDRLDNQMPKLSGPMLARPSEMARRMWYDTVSHGSRTGLRAAVDAFGADRLAPGSDFPVLLDFEPYGETFAYVSKAGLSAEQANAVLYENAAGLLGL